MFREQGDKWACAQVLTHMAVVPLRREDNPRAAEYAEEAFLLARRTEDRFAPNNSLNPLAQAAWASGEHRWADRYLGRRWLSPTRCGTGLTHPTAHRARGSGHHLFLVLFFLLLLLR